MHLRKLLNIEKNSKDELLIRENLIKHRRLTKDGKQYWNDIQYIEEDNIKLERNIHSICNQVIWKY